MHGHFSSFLFKSIKKRTITGSSNYQFGAGSRGRTDTVLLPLDFESSASTNSAIPALTKRL